MYGHAWRTTSVTLRDLIEPNVFAFVTRIGCFTEVTTLATRQNSPRNSENDTSYKGKNFTVNFYTTYDYN